MNKDEERREEIEARLRVLHHELYYSKECGDWMMTRSLEKLIDNLQDATALTFITVFIKTLKEIIEQLGNAIVLRKAKRKEIEDLEEELENLKED